jgi:hypothetical protein
MASGGIMRRMDATDSMARGTVNTITPKQRMRYLRNLILLLLWSAFGCPSRVPRGTVRYEFLSGGTVCVDKGRVVDYEPARVLGAGGRVNGISVRVDSTAIRMMRGRRDPAYFRDLAFFMRGHPEKVTSEANGTLLKVDVMERPAAEVHSGRVIDLLAPGDGTTPLFVSASLRETKVDLPEEQIADVFFAVCGSDRSGRTRCWREFPILGFLGFLAVYELPGRWEGVIEKDQAIRSRLATMVKPCN